MDFNPDIDYSADIATYRRTREKLIEGPECKHKQWMISNLDYAIEWLETGRRPGNKRGVERLAAYQREIPTDVIERYMQPVPQLDTSRYTRRDKMHMEYILTTLTDRECECYAMHVGGQMSMRDVADLLDIDVSTVHETVKRAERKIKAMVNKGMPLLLDIVV